MADNGMKKKLPIGIEDFAEIRTEDFYYVDKKAVIWIWLVRKLWVRSINTIILPS